MKNKVKLSVVMQVYNAAQFIERAVQSVLEQLIYDIELIIVNDASTDDTLDQLNLISDSRLKIINNDVHSGVYFSRNVGLLNSTGEIITFVDAYDFISSNRFLNILAYFEQNPNVVHVETPYLQYFYQKCEVLDTKWKKGFRVSSFKREVVTSLGYFLPIKDCGYYEYVGRIIAHYGKERSVVLNDFTYWAYQNNEVMFTSSNKKERNEAQTYFENTFHKSDNLYIKFPFTSEVLNRFRFLSVGVDDQYTEANIELSKNRLDTKVNIEKVGVVQMLDFSEQTANYLYSQLEIYDRKEKEIRERNSFLEGDLKQVEIDKNNTLSIHKALEQKHQEVMRFYGSRYESMPRWWRVLGNIINKLRGDYE